MLGAHAIALFAILAPATTYAQDGGQPVPIPGDPEVIEVDAGAPSEPGSETDSLGDGLADPPPDAEAETDFATPEGETSLSEPLFSPDDDAPQFSARDAVTASPRDLAGEHGAVFTELGLSAGGPADASIVAFSPELGMRLWFAQDFLLEASFGMTVSGVSVSGRETLAGMPIDYQAHETRVDPGNPVMGARYSGAIDESIRLDVGLFVGIPLAARDEIGSDAETLGHRAASEASHHAALSMHGFYDPFRWAPERVSVGIPGRIVGQLDSLIIEGELLVALLIPVLGDRGGNVDFLVQGAVGVGVAVVGPFHLGVRIRAAGATSQSIFATAIASAEPWVRLRFDPVQLTLRSTVNLHGRDGLGGSQGPAFGLFLGLGVEF